MNLARSACIVVALVVSSGSVATAQGLDRGMDAFRAKDYPGALAQLMPLAELGNEQAQFFIAGMYHEGLGVLQDYAEAFKWCRLAAEQGFSKCQGALGDLYENGHGVPQDYVKAHMWYNIAGANGASKGNEDRDEIADQMTAADISQAQAMARECMSSNYTDCGW